MDCWIWRSLRFCMLASSCMLSPLSCAMCIQIMWRSGTETISIQAKIKDFHSFGQKNTPSSLEVLGYQYNIWMLPWDKSTLLNYRSVSPWNSLAFVPDPHEHANHLRPALGTTLLAFILWQPFILNTWQPPLRRNNLESNALEIVLPIWYKTISPPGRIHCWWTCHECSPPE